VGILQCFRDIYGNRHHISLPELVQWLEECSPLSVLPFCYVEPQVLAAMPTIYVIQADHSPLITELCGILTCCVAVIQAGIIMDAVLGRRPLSFGLNTTLAKTSKSA